MKLERLQEIFRKKFQAAFWNRARQYEMSIKVRRRHISGPAAICITPHNDFTGTSNGCPNIQKRQNGQQPMTGVDTAVPVF